MSIPPVPLEKLLRAETLSRSLHTLEREELEQYTARLIDVTTKLTHYVRELTKEKIQRDLDPTLKKD